MVRRSMSSESNDVISKENKVWAEFASAALLLEIPRLPALITDAAHVTFCLKI